jgi:transposase
MGIILVPLFAHYRPIAPLVQAAYAEGLRKERLGRVSKMGNRYLRKLLVVGAHAVLFHRRYHQDGLRTWAAKLMETKPFKLVAVAVANKLARIAFAVMRDGSIYGTAVP